MYLEIAMSYCAALFTLTSVGDVAQMFAVSTWLSDLGMQSAQMQFSLWAIGAKLRSNQAAMMLLTAVQLLPAGAACVLL